MVSWGGILILIVQAMNGMTLCNGKPALTLKSSAILTPKQIMKEAGIDPDNNYLKELPDHHHHQEESFKDDPNKVICMREGMKFITCFMGPKPVS